MSFDTENGTLSLGAEVNLLDHKADGGGSDVPDAGLILAAPAPLALLR